MWQITPLGVLAVAIGIAYEIGLRRLAKRQTLGHQRQSRRRSLLFYAGLIGLVGVVSGPLERWAMAWLTAHMVIHVLEMFFLPPLLVMGGARVPLLFALPVHWRRHLLRAYYQSRPGAWVRKFISSVTSPIVAIVLFNVVMVLWHLPRVYDWASSNDWSMNWLMAPSFIVAGLLFWRILLPSPPSPPRGPMRIQIFAIIVSAFEMLVLAMSLAIFTKTPWYSMNVRMDGPVAALRDQRWAAGILWICGDFWAVPAFVLVVHRTYAGGRFSESFERALGRA
jgi:putative membrane protein